MNEDKEDEAPSKLLKRARNWRKSGDIARAERLLHALVQDYPDDLDVRVLYGGLLFNADRSEEALVHFEKILAHQPRAETASLGLFHSLWLLGRTREAASEVRRFFAAGGESMEYRRLLRDIVSEREE